MGDSALEKYIRASQKRFVENMPTLQKAVGEPDRVDDFLGKLQQDSVSWKGLRLNLEVYESSSSDPVLIFHGGIGAYVRIYLCFLSRLCEEGFNIIAVDRPGHGFSEGRRGDCTVEDVADFIPLVIERAAKKFNDRVGMFGSSLGGITTFYLAPDLTGIRSALCHNWLYPGEIPDPNRPWLVPVFRFINSFAPRWNVSMRLLLDRKMMGAISESPYMVEYFRNYKRDPVYCHTLTLRSVFSYFADYRPKRPYSKVAIPVMGLIGENDGMLPLELSRRMWEKAKIPNGRLEVIPGAQHMLFFDNIPESLPIVAGWFRKTLG